MAQLANTDKQAQQKLTDKVNATKAGNRLPCRDENCKFGKKCHFYHLKMGEKIDMVRLHCNNPDLMTRFCVNADECTNKGCHNAHPRNLDANDKAFYMPGLYEEVLLTHREACENKTFKSIECKHFPECPKGSLGCGFFHDETYDEIEALKAEINQIISKEEAKQAKKNASPVFIQTSSTPKTWAKLSGAPTKPQDAQVTHVTEEKTVTGPIERPNQIPVQSQIEQGLPTLQPVQNDHELLLEAAREQLREAERQATDLYNRAKVLEIKEQAFQMLQRNLATDKLLTEREMALEKAPLNSSSSRQKKKKNTRQEPSVKPPTLSGGPSSFFDATLPTPANKVQVTYEDTTRRFIPIADLKVVETSHQTEDLVTPITGRSLTSTPHPGPLCNSPVDE